MASRMLIGISSLFALTMACTAQEAAPKIRILGVGNSFTRNSTNYLPAILRSDKAVDADVALAYIGGCSLDKHVNLAKIHEADPDDPKGKIYTYLMNAKRARKNVSLKEMLLDGPWDYVTIQQVSHKSHKSETFYPYAKDLYDYVRKYAPKATIAIHETWSHRIDCARTKNWKLLPEAMYEKLHANYAKVAAELGVRVIPVGTAFENAKKRPLWQYVPPKDFDPKALVYPAKLPDESKSLHSGYSWRTDKKDKTRKYVNMDGAHAGRAGEYLGALVWYEFFFGKDARAVTYVPKGLSEEQARSLREVAHQTMAEAK